MKPPVFVVAEAFRRPDEEERRAFVQRELLRYIEALRRAER